MKHPEDEIEALLTRLQPAAPDEALMARLRAARPQPQANFKSKRKIIYLWAPLAAAAGVALALLPKQGPVAVGTPPGVVGNENTSAPATDELQPVGSLQHLVDVADLGIVQDDNNMPVRLIRTRWIDEIIYVAGTEGTEPVKEGRLREEIVPVSLPIY
ncbi:hypothetical protein [Haloferula sp. BvORR071]|uniref:hypothetical protein n=1 Tax=Haloferula sp. BvORR071 TaxID=1396141 RepID=UPI0005567C56|nr:hypothetical protein [Haloferula sp. BvORR071]